MVLYTHGRHCSIISFQEIDLHCCHSNNKQIFTKLIFFDGGGERRGKQWLFLTGFGWFGNDSFQLADFGQARSERVDYQK